jgi:phytoene synthase
LLDQLGIAGDVPTMVLDLPALPAVCRDLAGIAREHFDGAAAALAECPRDRVRPAATMHAVYGRLLDRLVAADWADPRKVVSVPTPTKLWLALRHGLL